MSEAVRGPIRVRSAGSSARSTDGVRLQAHRSTPRRSGKGAGSLYRRARDRARPDVRGRDERADEQQSMSA